MKNSSIIAGLAAVTLLSVAGLATWQLTSPPVASVPSLGQLMSTPDTGLVESLDQSTESPASGGGRTVTIVRNSLPVASYTTNPDKTSSDIFFQDDGMGKLYRKSYYAIQPGDVGRRQRGIVFYTADGATVRNEEWDRLDGSAEKIGYLLGDGSYVESNLFEDGQTAASEKIWQPDPYSNGHVPKLRQEKRWRSAEQGHTLAYLDILNDDGTREQVEYDEHEKPLMEKHIGRWGTAGTTVKFFFPGTDKVRLESETDYRETHAKSFRMDGTLEMEFKLTSYSVEPTYYDSTGKTKLYEKEWFRQPELKDGQEVVTLKLFDIVIYNTQRRSSKDEEKRILTWMDGKLHITRFNYTEKGVTYQQVYFWYRENGTLEKVEYRRPVNDSEAPIKTVLHAESENIRADAPASLLVPPVVPEELPVPPPERSDH